MRRTLVVAIIVLAVVAGGVAVAQTAQRFSDVPADHPQAAVIDWAADVGLTTGYGAEAFAASVFHPAFGNYAMGVTELSQRWVNHMVQVITAGPCAKMIRTQETANGYVGRCGVQRHADGSTTVCDPWCD